MRARRARARAGLALSTSLCRLAMLALAAAGCAEAGPARAAPASPHLADGPAPRSGPPPGGPARAAPREASLRFELDERPFPSPLLDAVIADQPATLVVDTGATHHVLARWLADELGLPLSTAGDVGVDHAGRPVPLSRIDHARVALSGWGPIDAPVLLVVPVPDVLRRLGIGGFLAPQLLPSPGRAVVLDLRDGRMTEAPRDEAARALRARFGEAAVIELGDCSGPSQGRELTARASVEGIEVTLKVDSGASHSSLFAASPAGKALSPRARGGRSAYAASGRHTVPVLPGARLRLAGRDAATDIDLLPGAPRAACPSDGYAGMDVLRACVLLLAGDGGLAACGPP
ncbi:retropepsin-like aspartic protease [Sorangium sp. So ce1036]|uniref:retropepsin-like aspartic protease n=1 Tax=Sorangium sp. So ce1036 TaxID=3133328 RepID=UPI003F064495